MVCIYWEYTFHFASFEPLSEIARKFDNSLAVSSLVQMPCKKVTFGRRCVVIRQTTSAIFQVVRRKLWLSRTNGQSKFRTLTRNVKTPCTVFRSVNVLCVLISTLMQLACNKYLWCIVTTL